MCVCVHAHPRRYPPLQLASTARRLLLLLPEHDMTSTLVTVMAHLDLGPDVMACHVRRAGRWLLALDSAIVSAFSTLR